MALYYASKSLVRLFSLALYQELRGSGVTVTCVAPGPVRTNFLGRADARRRHSFDTTQGRRGDGCRARVARFQVRPSSGCTRHYCQADRSRSVTRAVRSFLPLMDRLQRQTQMNTLDILPKCSAVGRDFSFNLHALGDGADELNANSDRPQDGAELGPEGSATSCQCHGGHQNACGNAPIGFFSTITGRSVQFDHTHVHAQPWVGINAEERLPIGPLEQDLVGPVQQRLTVPRVGFLLQLAIGWTGRRTKRRIFYHR